MRHDRDGEIRRQLADVFHLQPDRGFQFFARFCRFLQTCITAWARNGTTAFGYPRLSARAHGLNSGRKPLAIRYRRRTQTAGVIPRVKGVAGIMFQRPRLLCRRPQRAVGPFADGGIVQRVVFASGADVALPSHLVLGYDLHRLAAHRARLPDRIGAVIGIPLLPQLSSADSS